MDPPFVTACISKARRDAHVATELFTVFVTAPLLWHIGGKVENRTLGNALRALGVVEGIIDAWLLLFQWPKRG